MKEKKDKEFVGHRILKPVVLIWKALKTGGICFGITLHPLFNIG